MSVITWVLLGLGSFALYCAYKGINPLVWVTTQLGIQNKAPIRLGGPA